MGVRQQRRVACASDFRKGVLSLAVAVGLPCMLKYADFSLRNVVALACAAIGCDDAAVPSHGFAQSNVVKVVCGLHCFVSVCSSGGVTCCLGCPCACKYIKSCGFRCEESLDSAMSVTSEIVLEAILCRSTKRPDELSCQSPRCIRRKIR
eukprot:scaffold87493_cov25-Tisochrysis_lutea.AAC.2